MNVGKTTIRNNEIRNNAPVPLGQVKAVRPIGIMLRPPWLRPLVSSASESDSNLPTSDILIHGQWGGHNGSFFSWPHHRNWDLSFVWRTFWSLPYACTVKILRFLRRTDSSANFGLRMLRQRGMIFPRWLSLTGIHYYAWTVNVCSQCIIRTCSLLWDGIFETFKEQGIDSASRYDNSVPYRFPAPIDCYKISAQITFRWHRKSVIIVYRVPEFLSCRMIWVPHPLSRANWLLPLGMGKSVTFFYNAVYHCALTLGTPMILTLT